MFEELIRRVRVLNDLLKEQKTPILEPSSDCADCQYFERCFMKKKSSKQISLMGILGKSKED
jgi:CRISPR-associated exonuclease Cas4